jgi:hypothetical protein
VRLTNLEMKLVRLVISTFLSITLFVAPFESSHLSFKFLKDVCEDSLLNNKHQTLHLSTPNRRFLAFTLTHFDMNSKPINCEIYQSNSHQSELFPQCERKDISSLYSLDDELEIPFHSDQSGGSLQICLIPDIIDMDINSTNSTSPRQPTPSPSSKTTISAPTHPFMSTQAILIPLIFFAIITFGGLSYHFELYRHLPFCSKPR